MEARLTVRVPGSLSGIRKAGHDLAAFSTAHALSQKATWPFQVALDEVLSNVVRYGLQGGNERQEIEIEFRLEDGVLELAVLDEGPPFDPLGAAEPDVTQPVESRPVGGLGIALVRKLMAAVEYERREGRNRLVFSRRVDA